MRLTVKALVWFGQGEFPIFIWSLVSITKPRLISKVLLHFNGKPPDLEFAWAYLLSLALPYAERRRKNSLAFSKEIILCGSNGIMLAQIH